MVGVENCASESRNRPKQGGNVRRACQYYGIKALSTEVLSGALQIRFAPKLWPTAMVEDDE